MNLRQVSAIGSAVVILVFLAGFAAGRTRFQPTSVHAQEKASEYSPCRVVVPRDWGAFRGASAYGLAFEDGNGTVRFLLHPPCGSLDGPTATSAVDLTVQRR